MLNQLSKFAEISSILRAKSLEKNAVLDPLTLAGKGALALGKGVGKMALKHPGAALATGLTAATAVPAAWNAYQQTKTKFDPNVLTQRNQMMAGPGGM